METLAYLDIKDRLRREGYSHEIDWAENVSSPESPEEFFYEYAYVVINSGMKAQIARKIYEKVIVAIREGKSTGEVFGHKGKSGAIDHVYENREDLFRAFMKSKDKLEFLKGLPWIGEITKYHLAKNYGIDAVKPDRHLVRIAASFKLSPWELCGDLAQKTGDRIGTVDLVIWRAANLGWL